MKENTDNQRDGFGRFKRGCRAGPGVPKGGMGNSTKLQQLRLAIVRAVSVKDLEAIVYKLVELAKDGDVRASQLLLDRVLGKPVDSPELFDRIGKVEHFLGLAS